MRIVCTILSTNHGIDIMSEKLSAKIMSTDKYVIIVHEDGYAIKNTIKDKLLTLYSHELDAKKDLQILLEKNS